MPTPMLQTTTETWLAKFSGLAATLPSNCPPAWKAEFYSLGAGIYTLAANALGLPAPAANGTLADNVLSAIRGAGAQGLALAAIIEGVGKTERAVASAIATLKGKNLVTQTGEMYSAVGNVQGIKTGTRSRGRPRSRKAA